MSDQQQPLGEQLEELILAKYKTQATPSKHGNAQILVDQKALPYMTEYSSGEDFDLSQYGTAYFSLVALTTCYPVVDFFESVLRPDFERMMVSKGRQGRSGFEKYLSSEEEGMNTQGFLKGMLEDRGKKD